MTARFKLVKSTINNPEHSLPYHLRGAFRGFETILARYLETNKLPLSYFHILRLQWHEIGSTQSEIAEKSFMTESVAAQVIKKMVADKLLIRARDTNDGRTWRVTLTEKGLKLREKIVAEGIQISRQHQPNISKEDALTTIKVLKEIRNAFDRYNAEYVKNQD